MTDSISNIFLVYRWHLHWKKSSKKVKLFATFNAFLTGIKREKVRLLLTKISYSCKYRIYQISFSKKCIRVILSKFIRNYEHHIDLNISEYSEAFDRNMEIILIFYCVTFSILWRGWKPDKSFNWTSFHCYKLMHLSFFFSDMVVLFTRWNLWCIVY